MLSSKRQRPFDTPGTNGARPSKRPKVDLELAQLWENLVDESEETRLDAVYEILTTYLKDDSPENAISIAKRLFRGLCSSRKNARQGFYVTLTGALSMKNGPFGTRALSMMTIISLLDTQTISEAGTSGQDERDHHFGRLLGCKALLESKALWDSDNAFTSAWNQIVDLVFRLMARKPWLRSESTSIICAAISRLLLSKNLNSSDLDTVLTSLLHQLKARKLLDTIDGVGMYLAIFQVVSKNKPSKNIWATDSPLRKDRLQKLKTLILDKRQPKDEEQTGESLTGTTVWSPRLHPSWPMILRQLNHSEAKQVSLDNFWQEVVDEGLFDATSTPERKYTGFLVLGCALKELKPQQTQICFSKNLMACLIQSLRSSNEAYLQKVALTVFEEYEAHARTYDSTGVHEIINGLLLGCDFVDFDTLTKSKIVASLFDVKPLQETNLSDELIRQMKTSIDTEQPMSKIAMTRKSTLNVFSRAMLQAIRGLSPGEIVSTESQKSSWTSIENILHALIKLKDEASKQSSELVTWDKASYEMLQEKVSQILEAVLANSAMGETIFFGVVYGLRDLEIEAEDTIQNTLKSSWSLFEALSTSQTASLDRDRDELQHSIQRGLRLLQAFLLYEVYDGDIAAVEMLEDLTAMMEDFSVDQDAGKVADQIVEIVISFLSKASKFRRKVCTLIFEAIAGAISLEGLGSICHILSTKENKDGQQALFEETGDVLSGDASAESSDNEDGSASFSEDSDVEIVSANGDVEEESDGNEDAKDSDLSTDAESSSEGTSGADEDEDELAKFEGALAAALGTRKLNENDMTELGRGSSSESESDSDMSDSEMMELDDKLAEVFRNQQDQASAQKMRKEEMKYAKENVVNLKNRGIDLIELYFRTQHAKGRECVLLLVSMLQMTGTTNTQQLVNRGANVVKNFVQRNRGSRLPKVESDVSMRESLKQDVQALLELVVDTDASNLVIEVAGQLNILLCKLLVEAGQDDVDKIITGLAGEQRSRNGDMRKAVEAFWSRYDAWITSRPDTQHGKSLANIRKVNGNQGTNEEAFAIRGRKKQGKKVR